MHISYGQMAFRRIENGSPFRIQGKGVPEAELKNFFKQHDRNGDGVLDKKELKEAFNRLGALVPGWRAYRGLKHADANGDGFINEQELAELVKYAKNSGFEVK